MVNSQYREFSRQSKFHDQRLLLIKNIFIIRKTNPHPASYLEMCGVRGNARADS
jgi:hypothetical protein